MGLLKYLKISIRLHKSNNLGKKLTTNILDDAIHYSHKSCTPQLNVQVGSEIYVAYRTEDEHLTGTAHEEGKAKEDTKGVSIKLKLYIC